MSLILLLFYFEWLEYKSEMHKGGVQVIQFIQLKSQQTLRKKSLTNVVHNEKLTDSFV